MGIFRNSDKALDHERMAHIFKNPLTTSYTPSPTTTSFIKIGKFEWAYYQMWRDKE